MEKSQKINKYDSIIDVIFIGTKDTAKVEIILTKFDAELAERELCYMDDWQIINEYDIILDVIFDPKNY